MSGPYRFLSGPWENSERPTIIKDSHTGGDPHILATLARIHDPNAIYELVRLANLATSAINAGYKFEKQETLSDAAREIIESARWD